MIVDQIIKYYNAATRNITLFGGLTLNGPLVGSGAASGPLAVIVYGVSFAPNAAAGNYQVVTITDGVAFAIAAPTNPPATGAMRLSITFRNASGGAAGAGTFNVIYKMTSNTLAVIANGFSRTYEFQWNGVNWVEVFETAADVAN